MYFFFIIPVILLTATIYFVSDYIGPSKIKLKPSHAFGLDCMRARDLIVQEYDNKGALWATRGFIIYCLRKGAKDFVKIARVPAGSGLFWFNNFRIIRIFTLRSECVEMTISEDGKITAFASGIIWLSSGPDYTFHKIKKLENFGLNTGRGIMSTGLLQSNKDEFYLGEYFNNPQRTNVRIFSFNNASKAWGTAYDFKPGHIRHIHALQKDPYSGRLWVCVGDEGNEPMIGWSDDNYRSINPIGSGSQIWRTCQLVFTEEAIIWGTDSGSEDLSGIYRWDRNSMTLELVYKTDGAVFFAVRLNNGTIALSTDREGFPNEKDDKTKIIILNSEGKIDTITCGTWKYRKHGFRFNFAKLRLQRSSGNNSVVISILNQLEYPESELLLISEDDLCNRSDS